MQIRKWVNVKIVQCGIGTDFLWILIILAGFLFFTSLVPIAPNDYWWHLRIGQVIFSEQTIPTINLYSWSVPVDQPFFYGAWLGEWLLFLFHQLGDLSLNIFIKNMIIGITFLLIGVEAHRRSGSWRVSALSLALASLMSTNNLLLRPQIWAFLPFVITYSLLGRYQNGKLRGLWLLICPFMMIFWVNTHGSFVLGISLFGIFLIGETISFLFKSPNALLKPQLAWLAIIAAISSLSTLINPKFFNIYSYVLKLMTDPPSQKLIEEWQSPAPVGLANSIFYISIISLIIVKAYSQKKTSPTNIILLTAFLWLAWSGQRYVIWYAIIAMPLLAETMSGIHAHMRPIQPSRNLFNYLIAFLIILPVFLVQPWFVERFPLPDTYWDQVQNDPTIGPLLSVTTPVGATQYLQQHPGGRLFNELGYGSYLIWALPQTPVFVDPRIELYPMPIWDDYIDISNGVNVMILLSQYKIDQVVLDKALQPELSITLADSSSWIREYQDSFSEVWRSTTAP